MCVQIACIPYYSFLLHCLIYESFMGMCILFLKFHYFFINSLVHIVDAIYKDGMIVVFMVIPC